MATAQRKSNALSLPDDMVGILAAEDKRKGFPSGTMQSLMTQKHQTKGDWIARILDLKFRNTNT